MTFTDIVIKNLKYNIRRFLSFFFVNSFVVAVLFMYGSLLFNDRLNNDPAIRSSQSLIVMAACGIIIFSIIFLAYTSIYFVKSRGREFGVYLTLGMTTRDLVRQVLLESCVVFIISALIGTMSGLLLGKLFYLALGKVLAISADLYFINWKSFLLSLGVFLLMFLLNMVFTRRFIHKLSIVDITKSGRTKGVAKQRPLVGIVSVIVFAVSLWFFHAVATGQDFIVGFVRAQPILSICVPVCGILGSLFFIIGFGIAGIRLILQKFPSAYNRNILLLAGLSHRFLSYRVSLYSVSLLIAFAVFFTGVGMSFYNYGDMTIDVFQPYDFMIERRGDINAITEDEVVDIVKSSGGEIKSISTLSYLDCQTYRKLLTRDGLFVNFRQTSYLVSESEFNRHMGFHINLQPDELLLAYNQKALADAPVDYDTLITVEPYLQGTERADGFRDNPTDMDSFAAALGGVKSLRYTRGKTSSMFCAFVDSYGNLEFAGAMASVVDDSVYEKIRGDQQNDVLLFNLKSGDEKSVFNALLSDLRKRNNGDSGLWASEVIEYANKEDVTQLRPISKAERFEILFRANGFLLFALSFLGLLFLMSSCIVLYYKLISDTDEESEQVSLLKKVGLTIRECRAYLQTHIAVIFFTPFLFGGLLGLYLVYDLFSFSAYVGFLVSKVAMMYGAIVLLDILLFFSLKRRYFKDVKLY